MILDYSYERRKLERGSIVAKGMKKAKKWIMIPAGLLLFLGTVLFGMYFYMTGDTTADYRFGYKLDDVLEKYKDLGDVVDLEESFAIPGLARTNVTPGACVDREGKEIRYEKKRSRSTRNMIPQGVCFAGGYIVISAYDSKAVYHSVLYVLDKDTRQYLTTILLEDKNHVGGIAFDGDRLWIAKSGDNALSAIGYERLVKAASLGEDCVSVPYDDTYSISCRASFVTYYNDLLWVGVFEKNSDSVSVLRGFSFEESHGVMGLFPQDELFLPELANGAAIEEIDGHVCLIVDSSHGRKKASKIHTYELSMDEDNFENAVCVLKDEYVFPPMVEEVEFYDGQVYFIFESAATKYSMHRSFRCKYPVDRVCAVKAEKLLQWTRSSYVKETVILQQEEAEIATDLGYHVSTSQEAKTIPAYVRLDKKMGVQMLYNPYTAKMLFNIVQDTRHIAEGNVVGTASWNDTMSKSGYANLQSFRHDTLSLDKEHIASVEIVTGIVRRASYNNQEKFNIVIGIKATEASEWGLDLEKVNYGYQNGIMKAFMENAASLYERLEQISYDVPVIMKEDDKQLIQYTRMQFEDILKEMKSPDSRFTVTVTGAGIGGGIADLLVGSLFVQNGIYEGNANCYTFGAFAVAEENRYEGTNIFNIVNVDDYVTGIHGNEPWGGAVLYHATDTFQRRYYGMGAGRELSELAHSMVLYQGILDEIETNVSYYAAYNTEKPLVFYGSVVIDRNCFACFQELEIQNVLELSEGTCLFVSRSLRAKQINIQGELKVHGLLYARYAYINNGIVSVDENCMIANEQNGSEGYLEITGNQGVLEINGTMNIPYFSYTAKTGKHIKLYEK